MKKKTGIGIYVENSDAGLKKSIDEYMRLVLAEAPSDVRCAAIQAIADIHKRPVNISNCHIK